MMLCVLVPVAYIAQKPSKMEEVGELFNDVSEDIFYFFFYFI